MKVGRGCHGCGHFLSPPHSPFYTLFWRLGAANFILRLLHQLALARFCPSEAFMGVSAGEEEWKCPRPCVLPLCQQCDRTRRDALSQGRAAVSSPWCLLSLSLSWLPKGHIATKSSSKREKGGGWLPLAGGRQRDSGAQHQRCLILSG